MPRAKRGTKRRQRVKKVLSRASGFTHRKKNTIRRGSEAVDRALVYAFRDRRAKKRDFRGLWIARLSAAASANGISYSRLIAALDKAQVALNRKVLSELAIADPSAFTQIVNHVRAQAPTQ